MSAFEPKWATPPGATALDLLHERGLAVGDLSRRGDHDVDEVTNLLFGLSPLTDEWAHILAHVLGSTPAFWLRREEIYRSDLQRLCGNASDDWLSELPVRDMVSFGWIPSGKSCEEARLNACAFLGVATSHAFASRYERLLSTSAYRTSQAFKTNTSALAAWLRKGEIDASSINCRPWSAEKLRTAVDDLRALTREREPSVFLPLLERKLAECGVAMVVARSPEGCRASGATRFLSPEKALLQLSFRYLADDQFWFTVFHEIAHLLLHAHEELFLEGLEERHSAAELEADKFAREMLFERVGVEALDDVEATRFCIARLAKRAGIAPGIVVGQLQEKQRIPFSYFNYLKVRYARWN